MSVAVLRLVPLVQEYDPEQDPPQDFLLSWINSEAPGARVTEIGGLQDDGKGGKDYERGFAQIEPSWSTAHGVDHARLSKDENYSMQQSVAYIRWRAQHIADAGIYDYGENDAFWGLTKLSHALPSYTDEVLAALKSSGKKPETWDEVHTFASSNVGPAAGHSADKWLNEVDDIMTNRNLFGVVAPVVGAIEDVTTKVPGGLTTLLLVGLGIGILYAVSKS